MGALFSFADWLTLMKKVVVVGLAFAIVGCTPVTYYRDGSTAADYRLQKYECSRDVGFRDKTSIVAVDNWIDCMEAHGWEQNWSGMGFPP